MSKSAFDKLFENYPQDSTANKLREKVASSIIASLSELQEAKKNLEKATLDNRRPLQDAVTIIDTLSIWLLRGLPRVVTNKLMELRAPFNNAITAYNHSVEKPNKLLRRGIVTKTEFVTLRNTMIAVANNFTNWLQEIKP